MEKGSAYTPCDYWLPVLRKSDRTGRSDSKTNELASRPVRNIPENRRGQKPIRPVQNRKNRKNRLGHTVGQFYCYPNKSYRKKKSEEEERRKRRKIWPDPFFFPHLQKYTLKKKHKQKKKKKNDRSRRLSWLVYFKKKCRSKRVETSEAGAQVWKTIGECKLWRWRAYAEGKGRERRA